MRRDELVDGEYYLIKYPSGSFEVRIFDARDKSFVETANEGYFSYVENIAKDKHEWARINPEEIFNSVPLNSQDGK